MLKIYRLSCLTLDKYALELNYFVNSTSPSFNLIWTKRVRLRQINLCIAMMVIFSVCIGTGLIHLTSDLYSSEVKYLIFILHDAGESQTKRVAWGMSNLSALFELVKVTLPISAREITRVFLSNSPENCPWQALWLCTRWKQSLTLPFSSPLSIINFTTNRKLEWLESELPKPLVGLLLLARRRLVKPGWLLKRPARKLSHVMTFSNCSITICCAAWKRQR